MHLPHCSLSRDTSQQEPMIGSRSTIGRQIWTMRAGLRLALTGPGPRVLSGIPALRVKYARIGARGRRGVRGGPLSVAARPDRRVAGHDVPGAERDLTDMDVLDQLLQIPPRPVESVEAHGGRLRRKLAGYKSLLSADATVTGQALPVALRCQMPVDVPGVKQVGGLRAAPVLRQQLDRQVGDRGTGSAATRALAGPASRRDEQRSAEPDRRDFPGTVPGVPDPGRVI